MSKRWDEKLKKLVKASNSTPDMSNSDGSGSSRGGNNNPPINPGNPREVSGAQQPQVMVPPSERPHNLSAAEMEISAHMLRQVQGQIEVEVPLNIAYLAYASIRATPEAQNLDVFKVRLVDFLNEQASYDMRNTIVNDAYYDQLKHMMSLSGLAQYQWKWIVGLVVFDDTEENIRRIGKMVYACRYQEFDSSVMLRKIVRLWIVGKRAERRVFNLRFEEGGVESDMIFSNHESLFEDIIFLLIIFLNRETFIKKISKRSLRDFTAVIRMLVGKYNIRTNDRRRAEALGPGVITLPRIAACFSQFTTYLFFKGYGRVIISTADFGNCPLSLFSPMLPSVIRKGYMQNGQMVNIHPQLILIAVLMDNVLHVRDKPTPLDQIWTNYLAAYNSTVLTDSARIEKCNLLEITIDGLFAEVITNLRAHCINRIRELRPHKRLDDIISEMNRLA